MPYRGTTQITKRYCADGEIAKQYLGDVLIWPSGSEEIEYLVIAPDEFLVIAPDEFLVI